MTTDEFVALLNKNIATKPKLDAAPFVNEVHANLTAPDEINWVEKGAVLGVKDQGECGSCWAFSTTGSIEGQYAILNNKKVSLSEQQLVDCSHENQGCNGGDMGFAFFHIERDGITTESDYPYTGKRGTCKSSRGDYKISGYVSVSANENALKTAVGTVGPVSVSVDAFSWQSYGGGVYDDVDCSGMMRNHAVLAVGYGKTDEKDYWLVKNSWGESWGEQGYMRLVRNSPNHCGIALEASYPKL